MPWETFTRRTLDPKLGWLERQLDAAGIPHRRHGHTFHAPILQVGADQLDAAWAILDPVDDVPDDDPRFSEGAPEPRHDLINHLRDQLEADPEGFAARRTPYLTDNPKLTRDLREGD